MNALLNIMTTVYLSASSAGSDAVKPIASDSADPVTVVVAVETTAGNPAEEQLAAVDAGGPAQGARSASGQTAEHAPAAQVDRTDLSGTAIEVTGFFAVNGTYYHHGEDHSDVALHEAEFDVAATPSEKVGLASSITLGEDNRLEITWATVDLALRSDDRRAISAVTLSAGLFNPSFGIENRCNNALNRKLSTPPLAVELTHCGWADVGVQLNLEGAAGNFAAFIVNGFEPSADVTADLQQLALDAGDELDLTPSSALGARLGVTVTSGLEIGGSYATGFNKSDKQEMALGGIDLTWTVPAFELKAEYISHSFNRAVDARDNHGFYVQPTVTLGRAYLTTRWDSFDAEGYEAVDRLWLGGGYQVLEGVEARLETTLTDDTDSRSTGLQLVAAF